MTALSHSRRDFLTCSVSVAGSLALSSMASAKEADTPPSQTGQQQTLSQDAPQPIHQSPISDEMVVIALLQMQAAQNQQETNLKKAEEYCRKAAAQGADLALAPEMWNIGYTPFMGTDDEAKKAWQSQAQRRDGEWVTHFQKLAKELKMAIGITYLEEWPDAPRNSLTVFDSQGKEVLTYAKIHTCDFSNFEAATTPGDDFYVETLTTAKGDIQLGAMICYDREFPESARCLMLKGAEIVLTPNACLLEPVRIQQFQIRAMENSMGVAMTNYPAPMNNGHSVAFEASGAPIIEAGEQEGIFLAGFDMERMRQYRQTTIWGNAYRRPHRYRILTETVKMPIFERINPYGEVFDASKR